MRVRCEKFKSSNLIRSHEKSSRVQKKFKLFTSDFFKFSYKTRVFEFFTSDSSFWTFFIRFELLNIYLSDSTICLKNVWKRKSDVKAQKLESDVKNSKTRVWWEKFKDSSLIRKFERVWWTKLKGSNLIGFEFLNFSHQIRSYELFTSDLSFWTFLIIIFRQFNQFINAFFY